MHLIRFMVRICLLFPWLLGRLRSDVTFSKLSGHRVQKVQNHLHIPCDLYSVCGLTHRDKTVLASSNAPSSKGKASAQVPIINLSIS